MKIIPAIVLSIVLALFAFAAVHAQTTDTIWLSVSTPYFKTGETVVAEINALSGALVQGLTFQLRYDPACLKPVSATSPIPGMNGLPLPQTPGVVDATFASGAPQAANGLLAEVRFIAQQQCDTSLTLESAALAVRNEAGLAAPLPGVSLGEKHAVLQIGADKGASDLPAPVAGGTPLVFGEESPRANQFPSWLIILFSLLAGIIGVLVSVNLLRKP